MTPSRPVMLYHGGKWKLAPWIIDHFPPHFSYVEPYGGAASILMRKTPARNEVYNDLDEEIVNVFRVLREPEQAERLRQLLELTPHSRSEYAACFDRSPVDQVERARRIIVRSFQGYGSNSATVNHKNGFRNRRAGSAGPALDWSRYPDCIPAFVNRLSAVTLECAPALEVMQRYNAEDTLFYVDPPYVRSSRKRNQRSYRHEMSDDDHIALAHALHELTGMVVLSGYATPLYERLYAGWPMAAVQNRTGSNSLMTECLWLSPKAHTALLGRNLPEAVNCR